MLSLCVYYDLYDLTSLFAIAFRYTIVHWNRIMLPSRVNENKRLNSTVLGPVEDRLVRFKPVLRIGQFRRHLQREQFCRGKLSILISVWPDAGIKVAQF